MLQLLNAGLVSFSFYPTSLVQHEIVPCYVVLFLIAADEDAVLVYFLVITLTALSMYCQLFFSLHI